MSETVIFHSESLCNLKQGGESLSGRKKITKRTQSIKLLTKHKLIYYRINIRN